MSSANIKISVIIPVLNGEKTLARCLESVAKQSVTNYEIIVVDNGSIDQTAEIAKSFGHRFLNFSYLLEKRRGRGVARQVGALAAKGEVIAMTDADCLVPANWLERLVAPIVRGDAEVVSGFEQDASGNYWSKQRQAEDWRFLQPRRKGDYINHLDTKNFAIRASLLQKLPFDRELRACEDWDLFIRLKMAGKKIYFLPDLLVAHFHDSSARAVSRTQFIQGKSAMAIVEKYRRSSKYSQVFFDELGVKFFTLRTFALFIPWVVWQFIYRPRSAPFVVLSDFAWKLGVIAFFLSRTFSQKKIERSLD